MKKSRAEDLIADVRLITQQLIHEVMLDVVDTIKNQVRNNPNVSDEDLYWDSINLTYTLKHKTNRFLQKLDKSIECKEEVERDIKRSGKDIDKSQPYLSLWGN